jgi:glycosyltransferase involved in cell wall biosynthesis
MDLVHLPAVRTRPAETLSHAALSVLHQQLRPADAAILFNVANAPLMPLLRLRRIPAAIHVDGLDSQRAKWSSRTAQRYYRLAHRLAVRWADDLVADALAMASHYGRAHGATCRYIPYGAKILDPREDGRLADVGLEPRGYHLVVARFEPENRIDVVLEGYNRSGAALPLVVVGSAPYAEEYSRRIAATAAENPAIRLLGSVWDQDLLDQLYANAHTYIHGHSVGGTNPSLLRAMGGSANILALDVVFNREVLADTGEFFAGAEDLARSLAASEAEMDGAGRNGGRARARVAEHYCWDTVATQYEQLCLDLVAQREAR